MSVIYLILANGALDGPVTLVDVPGIGCQVPDNAVELATELAVPAAGLVWGVADGEPVLLADHRGTVYRTDSGAEQPHEALGELPEGLTELPWPGRFYVWSGTAWVLDEAAQLSSALGIEREWRNAAIAATDYLAMPDYPISAEQRAELYAYRQELRDWPAAGEFPGLQHRPVAPPWIAEESQ